MGKPYTVYSIPDRNYPTIVYPMEKNVSIEQITKLNYQLIRYYTKFEAIVIVVVAYGRIYHKLGEGKQ